MNGDWIDRAARIVMQLGLPTVFAIVLLWFVLARMGAGLDQIVGEMRTQTQKLTEIQNHVIERDKRLFGYDWQHQREHDRQHSEGAQ